MGFFRKHPFAFVFLLLLIAHETVILSLRIYPFVDIPNHLAAATVVLTVFSSTRLIETSKTSQETDFPPTSKASVLMRFITAVSPLAWPKYPRNTSLGCATIRLPATSTVTSNRNVQLLLVARLNVVLVSVVLTLLRLPRSSNSSVTLRTCVHDPSLKRPHGWCSRGMHGRCA